MEQLEPRALGTGHREAATEYLFDMIDQLAKLARQVGDFHVAIHLEAIIAVRHAIAKDRSAA